MDLTNEQKTALRKFAAQQGRQWKACLRDMWMSGNYWGTDTDSSTLQQLRNSASFGPRGLIKVRPADYAESVAVLI